MIEIRNSFAAREMLGITLPGDFQPYQRQNTPAGTWRYPDIGGIVLGMVQLTAGSKERLVFYDLVSTSVPKPGAYWLARSLYRYLGGPQTNAVIGFLVRMKLYDFVVRRCPRT